LLSGSSVFTPSDKTKYEVVPIGITKRADGDLADASACCKGSLWKNHGICGRAIPTLPRGLRCWQKERAW